MGRTSRGSEPGPRSKEARRGTLTPRGRCDRTPSAAREHHTSTADSSRSHVLGGLGRGQLRTRHWSLSNWGYLTPEEGPVCSQETHPFLLAGGGSSTFRRCYSLSRRSTRLSSTTPRLGPRGPFLRGPRFSKAGSSDPGTAPVSARVGHTPLRCICSFCNTTPERPACGACNSETGGAQRGPKTKGRDR